mmetsp:Transcript_18960/g.48665  ORF Transcript_18960/g.48665 Transcript_18960/m.48665 type:complete len:227 (+) Transcript_18960:111-791(+)
MAPPMAVTLCRSVQPVASRQSPANAAPRSRATARSTPPHGPSLPVVASTGSYRYSSWHAPALRDATVLGLAVATLPVQASVPTLWELSAQHNLGLEAAALGITLGTSAYTLLFTGRFLLSCFPQLERKRKEMPWAVLTTSTDPFLEPLRPVFGETKNRFEGMDVAAVVGLTLLSIGQEVLFGADGLMLRAVPYAAAQDYLETLLLLQRGFCLPMWLLLVFRSINYI